ELGLGNGFRRLHLPVFGESLGIIDPYEHSSRRNVLATFDWYFLDPSVDPCSDIEPCRIDLALYEQWLRSQEIKDGKRDSYSRNDADDDCGNACRSARALLPFVVRWLGRTLSVLIRGRQTHAWFPLAHDRMAVTMS